MRAFWPGLWATLLLGTTLLPAYVQLQESGGSSHRTDAGNIQFLLNSPDIATLKNSKGQLWIAAGSDVPGAVAAAMATWNGVSTATVHFAPAQMTNLVDDPDNPANIISFDKSAEAQMLLNGAVAVSDVISDAASGAILKTDILFSSQYSFSTNLTPGTFDLQDVLTHELGHCLGANHTGILSATLFQAGPSLDASASNVADATGRRALHPDDIAFVTSVYPAPGNGSGAIAGTLRDSNGSVVKGGLVAAANLGSGALIGGLSSLSDGSYSFLVPPGTYQVWAEPLSGIVGPGNLQLSAAEVDTDFQITRAPAAMNATAGTKIDPEMVVESGTSPVVLEQIGAIPVSATHETYTITSISGPAVLNGGSSYQILLIASGVGADFSAANISLVGPVALSGSVTAANSTAFLINVQTASVSNAETASVLVNYKGNTSALTGGLTVIPAAPSFTAAGVASPFSNQATVAAPGAVISLYGSNMGPAAGMATAGFDAKGMLATSLGGFQVLFDGEPAPVFYAGLGQINVEVPFEVAGKATTTVVASNNGVLSSAISLPVAAAAPALYTVAVNPDYSLNTQAHPIARGEYAQLYCAGLGALGSTAVTGGKVQGLAPADESVVVTINGQNVTPDYAGGTPGFTGLDQVNVQIPAAMKAGQATVSITVGGQTSNTISVWVK